MKLTQTERPVRIIDLEKLLTELSLKCKPLMEVYLFGSRRFETGSVRSDVDLLLITQDDTIDYHLPSFVRRIEPYIDVFQVIGGKAISYANNSQINGSDRKDLFTKLSAHLLWTRANGWVSGDKFKSHEVLSQSTPEYTVAHLEPGVRDPADAWSDVVIVTALQEEYQAVYTRLRNLFPLGSDYLDVGSRFTGPVQNGVVRQIVVVRATRMGPVAAAVETALALCQWSPKLVLLVGIAGGVGKSVRLGDVIIPDRIVEYDALKVLDHSTFFTRLRTALADRWRQARPKASDEKSGFHGIINPTSPTHRRRVEQWDGMQNWLTKYAPKLPTPRKSLGLHCNAMASGTKVVAVHTPKADVY